MNHPLVSPILAARLAAHAEFHRQAAESARERGLITLTVAGQELWEGIARLHDLAASGVMAFADCPTCHETKEEQKL